MFFLRSCAIIYEDLSTKKINECDGLKSLITMPNLSSQDILIIVAIILIFIYFVFRILLLLKKD